MRTVHVLRKLDPNEWGGTEMAIQRLFEGLRGQGVTPVVFCPRLDQQGLDDPFVRSGYEVQRFKAFVPVLGISSERRRQMVAVGGNLMSFDLVSSLWREKDVAVIHTHALGRIGGIARSIAKKRQIPFVITIHGGVLDLPENVKRSFNAPIEDGWEWGKLFGLLFQSHKLFQDADAIVTCNVKEAALWREKFPAKKVVVQPHGVDARIYQPDQRASADAAFPQLRGRRVLLSLGRVDPIKNQGWLLDQMPEILRKHPDAILVLAGACTDEPYGRMIDEKIRALGITDQVLLTGGLPSTYPRLIGLLQKAAVVILPSVSETFGLVILEAWAAGTMVMTSRTSGGCGLVEHGTNGWIFDLTEPWGFHRALDETLAHPERAAEMARRGAAKAGQEYGLGAVAGKMKKVYEELLEEKQCAT
jgi:glycosyltransferase involved in cell wall biosynthesis